MTPSEYLVGFDLSLSSTGICCLHRDWGADATTAKFATITGWRAPRSESDRSARLDSKVLAIIDAAEDMVSGCTWAAAIEGLPTHRAYSIVQLAELRGVLRLELSRSHVDHYVPSLAECRAPVGWAASTKKALVTKTVQSIPGLERTNADEADAFLPANWLAQELGHDFIAVPR